MQAWQWPRETRMPKPRVSNQSQPTTPYVRIGSTTRFAEQHPGVAPAPGTAEAHELDVEKLLDEMPGDQRIMVESLLEEMSAAEHGDGLALIEVTDAYGTRRAIIGLLRLSMPCDSSGAFR